MKRMKRVAIALALLTCLLTGCLNKEAKDVFVTPIQSDTETTKFLYTPGTYRGTASGYNGPIEVEVTVSDSKIKSIEIISSSESNYIPESDPTVTEEPDPSDETDPTENPSDEPTSEEVEVVGALDGMINEILLQQSTQIDTVSGATVSCKALLEAIQRALTEAALA